MSVTLEMKQAYSEVYEFINLLDVDYIHKVPEEMMKVFKEERDPNYCKNINPWENIGKQGLKQETMKIISMLYFKYWSEGKEHEKLKEIFDENERKYLEKYDYNNLFKPIKEDNELQKDDQKDQEIRDLIVVDEEVGFWTKIFNKIKMLFRR